MNKLTDLPRVSNGGHAISEVQIDMVAYLFELVSSLCIGVSSNISESPGFETFAHTYKS